MIAVAGNVIQFVMLAGGAVVALVVASAILAWTFACARNVYDTQRSIGAITRQRVLAQKAAEMDRVLRRDRLR